ncbi:hypothetical protein Acr_20g0005860 [Actinidia rufa]|uniref:Transposase (putative) gypsy type domain-containing protein n=1 Tax=Actinidia rufa TaxID=165716 RepID=A0A7J0GDJ9_9ERIC|nr:hypothetical protein Acr_20g0005860 [Actinidia rufa]
MVGSKGNGDGGINKGEDEDRWCQKLWCNQQSILLGFLGTGPRTIKGRPAQTNRNKGPGRGRSKLLRRGDQTKATAGKRAQRGVEYIERTFERWWSGLFIDGVMGRVRGSRRDPRKDEYGKISRRYRRHNWKDCHLEKILSALPRPRARRRQYFGSGRSDEYSEGGSGELSGELGWMSGDVQSPLGRERLVNQRSAMSKRLKLSDLAKVAQPPESKKAKTDTGASGAPARPPIALGEGSSIRRTLGEALVPQASVMASAATVEKILAGVILPADKEKVDKLTFDQVVTKFIHALGQGVILGSSLAVRSRDFAESALNQKAVAESAEMEMVRAQNRAIELEGALSEEKAKGNKLAEDADARSKVIAKLEARISELEKSQSLTQGRIIAAFKESDDFLEAVRGSASSYFGDGFDFCKRQLAHQYPDLGVDLEDVEMDHEFLAKEEVEAEQRAAEEGAAGAEGISDHLGAKSYIDETSQSPSFPPTNSPKMDTSSLTKEGNAMSQAELDKLGSTYSFPSGIRLRIPGDGETILSARQGEVAFYEAAFLAGLRLPLHPTIRKILIHYKICPAQLSPNAWRSVICSLVIWRHFKRHMSCDEFRCLYSLSPLPNSGWYYFKARPEKNLLRGSPSNVKGWKTRFFFASGDEWEFPSGTTISDSTPRVPRSWGMPGKSCNKLPTLSEIDAKRTVAIFGKIEPGGYFEVSKILGSRTFNKHFAVGCTALSTSGGDNTTSGDEGEFVTREDSVEYLGVIRRDIGGVIRRAHPAMSARGKAKAEKATKTAKPPTKGVVIREKRTREGNPLIEIGEPDSSKGKEAVPPPPPKRFKSNRGAINAGGRAGEAGTSSPGGDMGSESMSDASVARRLLTGVIPASDKKEVVVFASSLALRSQEHLHDMDFHMARADSAELELVKAQNRAVKAENRLAELSEEGSKPDRAVIDSAATYFSEGFEFCKRQLLHQFPNLGVDVANMAMDPSFVEEEEARKEEERSCCRSCS